jgi:hypothetical protein
MLIGVLIWFYKELIRKKYYEIRFPEKLIKVVIHYKGGMYKRYWRLVPDDNIFNIGQKQYQFDDKQILKDNDFYSRSVAGKEKLKIEGKEYDLIQSFAIKYRWEKYPELHYFYNCPLPIMYDLNTKSIKFTSAQLNLFKENDLFNKLLTLKDDANIIMILLVLGVINALISAFILAKSMGWLE